jgi:hypothetical protein
VRFQSVDERLRLAFGERRIALPRRWSNTRSAACQR